MTVEDLHKYKNELTAGLNRNLSEFEKNFFLVSAGTFAFSVTFITDIVKIQGSIWIFFLFFAWALIALSVGLIMYAFLASANKSGEIWTCVDNYITSNSLFTPSSILDDSQALNIKSQILNILNRSKSHLKNIRNYAATTFILGISSFAFFIAVNLISERNKKPQQNKTTLRNIILKTASDSFQIQYNDTIFILKKDSIYEAK